MHTTHMKGLYSPPLNVTRACLTLSNRLGRSFEVQVIDPNTSILVTKKVGSVSNNHVLDTKNRAWHNVYISAYDLMELQNLASGAVSDAEGIKDKDFYGTIFRIISAHIKQLTQEQKPSEDGCGRPLDAYRRCRKVDRCPACTAYVSMHADKITLENRVAQLERILSHEKKSKELETEKTKISNQLSTYVDELVIIQDMCKRLDKGIEFYPDGKTFLIGDSWEAKLDDHDIYNLKRIEEE